MVGYEWKRFCWLTKNTVSLLSAPWHSASRKSPTNFRCTCNLCTVLEMTAELSKFPRWLNSDLQSQNNFPTIGRAGLVCSFSSISTTKLTLTVGRNPYLWLPKPSSHTSTCLLRTRNKPATERCTHLFDCCQMLPYSWQTPTSSQRVWFPSPTYPSVFSALSNPYTLTPESGCPEFGESWGAPEESMGISLCL